MSNEFWGARHTLIWLALITYLIVGALVLVAAMPVDYSSAWPLAPLIGVITLFGSLYCSWRGMLTCRAILETSGIGFLATAPVVVANYLAAYAGFELADERLSAIDNALGLDWHAFVNFVDARPWLAYSLDAAYQSLALQLVLLPVLLSIAGRAIRAYRMVSIFVLIGLISSLVSVWVPAVSAFPYYGVELGTLRSIDIHFGYFFLEQFNAVRTDPDFVFSLDRAAGIVTFPSVHAAVAVLCIWATWDIRWLRYPFLFLNLAMIVSVVTHGSHYFIDAPAGIVLCLVCIKLAQVLPRILGWVPVRLALKVAA